MRKINIWNFKYWENEKMIDNIFIAKKGSIGNT